MRLLLFFAAAVASAAINIDYPSNESIFPPKITPPTFLWRDDTAASSWRIEIAFADGGPAIVLKSHGELMRVGPVDDSYGGYVAPTLTPEQSASHTWKPDPATWADIQTRSVRHPATIVIAGLNVAEQQISRAQVVIHTSTDPIEAPLFYRDVPLLEGDTTVERGNIKPLPDSLLPLIKWRLRYLDEPAGKTVMENLPTCANCHSVSRDGKTLGLDVDGPNNNKALYGLLPVRKISSISKEVVLNWNDFTENSSQRVGFMSQVSPNGKYVVTSVDVPGAVSRHMGDRLYQGFYPSYGFVQVFFPTRGILAWYSRESGKMQPLPGADDPKFVQACAFWSPDSSYLVFSRAVARDPCSPGQPPSKYANDPNETQIQYDLYHIPFNDGKGGTPERIIGASQNGKSNDFPKVSPDGKWIVFVQNKTGLLMRPDSELYIVPAQGGVARRLNCNGPLMNSWHSFSPNSRWLVFSSKRRSLYTQLYLTHIDENGNDSPAILIDNTTAANRAANIPEFVNIPKGGLEKIEAPATEYYRLFNVATNMMREHRLNEAIPAWQHLVELDPDDGRAHFNLGYSLTESGDVNGAVAEFKKAAVLVATEPGIFANLALAQTQAGDLNGAIANYRKALELVPTSASVEADLGVVLAENGQAPEGLEHLRHVVENNPQMADAHNKLASVLANTGDPAAASIEMEKAVSLQADSLEYRLSFAILLGIQGRTVEGVAQLQKAVELSGGKDWQSLDMLATAYFNTGRRAEAVATARQALGLAEADHNAALAGSLRSKLARYEQSR